MERYLFFLTQYPNIKETEMLDAGPPLPSTVSMQFLSMKRVIPLRII